MPLHASKINVKRPQKNVAGPRVLGLRVFLSLNRGTRGALRPVSHRAHPLLRCLLAPGTIRENHEAVNFVCVATPPNRTGQVSAR